MGGKKKTTPKTYKVRISLTAAKVGDSVFKTIDRIANNPFAFRECEEIRTKTKMYRRAVCLSWFIIYRVKTNEITILGIIHQSRRPSGRGKLRKIK